jgi:hypothetical protein
MSSTVADRKLPLHVHVVTFPNDQTHLLPGANHTQTLDCPELLVTEMMAAMT